MSPSSSVIPTGLVEEKGGGTVWDVGLGGTSVTFGEGRFLLMCEGNCEDGFKCQGAPQEDFHDGFWDSTGDGSGWLVWTTNTLILPNDQHNDLIPLKSLFQTSRNYLTFSVEP